MEYTTHQLARLAGVTTRTLRWYDQIGLLPPGSMTEGGYRLYGPEQVKRLQQILFYRALGVECKAIGPLLDADAPTRQQALQGQLRAIRAEQQRLAALAGNLEKTILELKGETTMTDSERFEGLKRRAIEDNEAQYGAEAREKYGDAAMDASNARVQGMSKAQWQHAQELAEQIAALLKELTPNGDPTGPEGQRLADLHRQWLCSYWAQAQYSKQAHRAMAQMYQADERFAAHYDAIAPGAAAFLCRAIEHYCGC